MQAVHVVLSANPAVSSALTHPAAPATVPAIKMAVMESVDLEICSAVRVRAFAARILALVTRMAAMVSTPRTHRSTASVKQEHLWVANVNLHVAQIRAHAMPMGAMEFPIQTGIWESVRRALIKDVPAPRPAVKPMGHATRTAAQASTRPWSMEMLSLGSARQAITGDATVHLFAVLRTVLAIRMDAMELMHLMEVRDFVRQGTISDVCVARYAERQLGNAPTTAVLGRTEFARQGIISAAIVIISCP
jgi:hypothetical protein